MAHGDLGIKNGVERLYGLKKQPDAATIQRIAKKNKWHPYETVACWYVWKSLEKIADASKFWAPSKYLVVVEQ